MNQNQMNQNQMSGQVYGSEFIQQWDQFKGEAKWHWDKFTDDTLTEIEGSRERLATKIQEYYGIAREDAHRQIEAFEMRCKKRCRNDFV